MHMYFHNYERLIAIEPCFSQQECWREGVPASAVPVLHKLQQNPAVVHLSAVFQPLHLHPFAIVGFPGVGSIVHSLSNHHLEVTELVDWVSNIYKQLTLWWLFISYQLKFSQMYMSCDKIDFSVYKLIQISLVCKYLCQQTDRQMYFWWQPKLLYVYLPLRLSVLDFCSLTHIAVQLPWLS